jgi:negative regulator of sigma E activity
MSRLDDELKIAFQREEPSADFTTRVLARINEAPAPQAKPTLWERLTGMFAMPALRYTAAGAMALLLIVIGIALLRSQRTAGVENHPPRLVAGPGNPAGEKAATDNTASKQDNTGIQAMSSAPDDDSRASAKPNNALNHAPNMAAPFRTGGSRRQRPHVAVVAKQPQPSPEAEAAKEKVLFALQITSETLNDAQRAISDDRSHDEKPEPVQNR